MYCRVLSSVPGFYSLKANSTRPQSSQSTLSPHTVKCPQGGPKSAQVENDSSKGMPRGKEKEEGEGLNTMSSAHFLLSTSRSSKKRSVSNHKTGGERNCNYKSRK